VAQHQAGIFEFGLQALIFSALLVELIEQPIGLSLGIGQAGFQLECFDFEAIQRGFEFPVGQLALFKVITAVFEFLGEDQQFAFLDASFPFLQTQLSSELSHLKFQFFVGSMQFHQVLVKGADPALGLGVFLPEFFNAFLIVDIKAEAKWKARSSHEAQEEEFHECMA
jgi:hypothetical protein